MFRHFCHRAPNLQSFAYVEFRIGRMPAEVQPCVVEEELLQQITHMGIDHMQRLIRQEEFALNHLLKERERLRQLISTICVQPSIQRVKQGYQVTGTYWSMLQIKLNEVAPKDKYLTIEEQIDWLNTRKTVFTKLSYGATVPWSSF